ncbi:MAG: phosphoglucosamine mutase [Parvibaculum sp.]|uniref:phosphoglucosamine mutase n=1 Tax=Parvibaculum sp. TaxID=2024848 RepID=UPI001D1DF982|nr:phosphoglucosamine mutase [Parvibaculum sp.]MBX3488979.1 phosphoglucosamine mutase [Parvibaculum sp.]MBX3496595.1 phosphoglucosamine mutase [Parvibaculum sp.]MCW5727152.1 phosphoglucosamine mutase [Parvibaculum sp.]
MSRKYFGTDGIRGKANSGHMTAETALRVGMAAGRVFRRGDHRHRVVIGKDTRLSGYMIEPALTAGFTSMGMDVFLFGPLPTPAVAMLTRSLRADLGVMISASHNSFEDNGIKLFGPDGFKLSDEVELAIEHHMDNGLADNLAGSRDLGRTKRIDDAQARYIEHVKHTFPKQQTLEGLRIVIDCANGAAYKVAPDVLWELGAEVVHVGTEPNGFNINEDCGSTAPERMCAAVRERRADIGIALDGDADRLIVADENGRIVDGDQIMGLIARHWKEMGTLSAPGVVATVMSNLGLERFLGSLDLALVRTQVGDRYVVEYMREHGYNVGGEQSGHIVLKDFSTTGDGLIAALQVLAVLKSGNKPVSALCHLFDPLPQLLKNVRFRRGEPLREKEVEEAIREGEARLGKTGRLVIRKSGTEPLIRVMGEGDDEGLVKAVVNDIVSAIEHNAA